MLDRHTQNVLLEYNKQIQALYRGRPYTKSVPFRVTLNAGATHFYPLWIPDGAYFEFAYMRIISTIAAVDLNICDTNKDNVFNMVVPDIAFYTPVDMGLATYRSVLSNNAACGIVDGSNSGAIVKGIILGWEVTREGNYR